MRITRAADNDEILSGISVGRLSDFSGGSRCYAFREHWRDTSCAFDHYRITTNHRCSARSTHAAYDTMCCFRFLCQEQHFSKDASTCRNASPLFLQRMKIPSLTRRFCRFGGIILVLSTGQLFVPTWNGDLSKIKSRNVFLEPRYRYVSSRYFLLIFSVSTCKYLSIHVLVLKYYIISILNTNDTCARACVVLYAKYALKIWINNTFFIINNILHLCA